MVIYIPQNVDIYNTHLKNLIEAYTKKGVQIIVGYETFIFGSVVPDIIHFHMVEGLLRQLNFNEELFFERLEFFKKKGVRFIYTAHNIFPHSKINEVNYGVFFDRFLTYISLVIHHGMLSIDILKKEFPGLCDKKQIVCHHGDYLSDMGHYSENQDTARKMLNLPVNKKIVLVFGQLQYKNTSFVWDIFREIKKKNKDCFLLMAGVKPIFKFNGLNTLYYKINNKVLNRFRFSKRLLLGRVSNYNTYLIFMAADMVFLPHNSGLTSGIIPMAATLRKPFVYPNIGVFENQAEFCIAEKYKCSDKFTASDAIDKILKSGISLFDNTRWLENNNWEVYVERVLLNL